MTLNQIIAHAAAAYPDSSAHRCWDLKHGCPVANPDPGDTLALFIVREIADTYDAGSTDAAQCEAVIDALNCASYEIERVANFMQNLTLPALRQQQTRKTRRTSQRKEAAHAGRRN